MSSNDLVLINMQLIYGILLICLPIIELFIVFKHIMKKSKKGTEKRTNNSNNIKEDIINILTCCTFLIAIMDLSIMFTYTKFKYTNNRMIFLLCQLTCLIVIKLQTRKKEM